MPASSVPDGTRLQLKVSGPSGGIRESLFTLLEPADPRNNLQPIQRTPSTTMAPGTLYRRVFWVDLGALVRDKALIVGDTLRVEYGNAFAEITFRK